MFRTLARKLTLAFSLIALLVAVLVAVLLRLSSTREFDRLLLDQSRREFKTDLVAYYQTHGSWDGVAVYWEQQFGRSAPASTPTFDPDNDRPNFRRERHLIFGLADIHGQVILPLWPNGEVGTTLSAEQLAQGEAIALDNQIVGTILSPTARPGLSPEESAYLRRSTEALLIAALAATVIAFLAGLWLARTLTRPLQALTAATHRMASGALAQEVPVKSADEIGQLAAAFNRMSRELTRANTARRQMTADVAHELRTPLTVIAGYIEALRDGELDPTPERLTVIYDEIAHLQHLVGDLRTLTQAEAGELTLNRALVVPRDFLQQAQATFAHQAQLSGVSITVTANPDLPALEVDEVRLAQVFSNLISNALRYTPSGGQIELGAALVGEQLHLTVRDTGAGIAPADLPLIFDRFYRAETARTAEHGESGLGLAIAKAIVEAHGGAMRAESVMGQGTTINLTLPVASQ